MALEIMGGICRILENEGVLFVLIMQNNPVYEV